VTLPPFAELRPTAPSKSLHENVPGDYTGPPKGLYPFQWTGFVLYRAKAIAMSTRRAPGPKSRPCSRTDIVPTANGPAYCLPLDVDGILPWGETGRGCAPADRPRLGHYPARLSRVCHPRLYDPGVYKEMAREACSAAAFPNDSCIAGSIKCATPHREGGSRRHPSSLESGRDKFVRHGTPRLSAPTAVSRLHAA